MSDREKLVIKFESHGDQNRDEARKVTGRGKDWEKERKIEENQRKSNVTTVRGRENKRGDREESKKRVQPKRDRKGNTGKRERENSPLSDPENRVASTYGILTTWDAPSKKIPRLISHLLMLT